MKIVLTSVMVDDQEKALQFYTEKLGFQKKEDISMGQYRWLTVTSPEGVAGVELVLEPMGFPPAQVFQKALYDAGVPATAFFTSDIQAEYSRLKGLGVVFRGEPKNIGPVILVQFEDNLRKPTPIGAKSRVEAGCGFTPPRRLRTPTPTPTGS